MDLILLAASDSSWLAGAGNVLKVLVGLGFVIFVHELGHFLVAKACGVKCEKFYVGFDVPIKLGPIRLPQTLGKFQWGETEYGIGIIPLGGYVKMLGQEDNPNAQAEANENIKVIGEDGEEKLDPRSFPAKSVFQRMAIISAGVIMNVIFAVFMAMVAYRMGVPHEPTDISGTAAGDPAWKIGYMPDDKILALKKTAEPSEHLRWRWDLRQNVAKAGISNKHPVKSIDMLVRQKDQENWYTITPTERLKEINHGLVSIGVGPVQSTVIGEPAKDTAAAKATPALKTVDKIVAVGGRDLPVDPETGHCFFHHVEQYFYENIDKTATITIERKGEDENAKPERLDVEIPPQPMKGLGLVMTMGPIDSIQDGSPAASSDLQVGDVITAIDGQPIGDPITLPRRFSPAKGATIKLTVERKLEGSEATEKVEVELAASGRKQLYYPLYGAGSRRALDAIGVAYEVRPLVAKVKAGTPAEKAQMQVGDEITSFRVVLDDDDVKKKLRKKVRKRRFVNEYLSVREMNDKYNWISIIVQAQSLDAGHRLELTYTRAKETKTVVLTPVEMADRYKTGRGIAYGKFERIHKVDSWGEAFGLGLRETKDRIVDVFDMLRMLARGEVGAGNLSGPLGIVQVASSEASQGWARLLIFLTLLSANLAILNFLPIPVLDGGHFVFLLWELVRGKPPSETVQIRAQMIGLIALLSLILFVTVNDIFRF